MRGVQLLAAQKAINRPGWWKGKFVLFQVAATVGGGWQTSVQRPTPPHPAATDKREVRAFIDGFRGGGTCRNSTVISNSQLQIGHQWSVQHHLGCCAYS